MLRYNFLIFVPFVLLSMTVSAACSNFFGTVNPRIRIFLSRRRKDPKFGRENRLKRIHFFYSDLCPLAPLREIFRDWRCA